MGSYIYYALIRLIKFILIPMFTVILLYRNRKQKLLLNSDVILYFGLAAAVNVIAMKLIMTLAGRLAMKFAGIELPYNKCYMVISVFLAAFALPKLLEMFSQMSQKVFHMSDKEVVKKAIDYYFLMVIAVVCFGIQIGLTTFNFNISNEIYRKLYLVACLAVGVKAVMGLAEDGSIKERINKNRDLLLSLPIALVFYFAFPSEHYLYQQFLAPLIIGCVGIKISKIFIAAFVPSTLVILIMMMASLSGAIFSMAYSGRNIRSYWGHISPTDFGTAVLMIVCFVWILFKDFPEELFVIPAGFSLFISFYITRCTTSGYLTLLLIGMFFCRAFRKRVVEKTGKFKWTQNLTDMVMLMVFPILGILVLAMVYAYFKEMPFAGTLDSIFHKRLSPAAAMLAEHGLKPFGTYFDMYGNGGSVISYDTPYTFIDSSYPQILIRYGILTYLIANVLWVYTTRKALKTGNRRVAYVMALLAVDFVMEHHWYELSYNVFVLLPFAGFAESTTEKESAVKRAIININKRLKNKKYALVFTAMCLIQFLAVFLFLPTVFSWLRTIFIGCGLNGGGDRNGKIVFVVESLILITVLAFVWNVSSLITDLLSKKKIRKSDILIIAVACILILGMFISGNSLINHIANENLERIESEREILELITSKSSGKVYADKLPEVYIRNINGISKSYLCGEDFARYENATIIADASWDSQCLIGRGFLYLQISDEDAIFTNDDSVINALKENDYKLKGYNSYEYKVDLMALAEMNDLDNLENGGVELKGKEHQLIYGPYLLLYPGRFTAKFEMNLVKDDFSQDDKICTLRVSSYYGRQVKATVDLYRRDFDDEGKLEYEMPFNGGGHNYEFLVFTEDDVELEIDSILYRRTPDYDVHQKIDSEGRVTRIENYDLDGNPYAVPGGYYGYEYAYDECDNAVMQRFLGSDFKPVLIKDGYAEIHREYNLKKELIGESYYGVYGEAIKLSGGYHSVEKVYDFSKNLISEHFYDLDGKPILRDGAYFKYIRVFDENGRWIRTEYYDIEDNLILQKEGYAIVERDYDEAGNVIEESYYGLQNEPVLWNDRYHKSVKAYDDKKQCIKEMFYGTDSEPIIQSGNYAGCERGFDEVGNVIILTHLGTDEKPAMTDWGYATWRRIYNSKRQVIREEYYDTADEKITRPAGYFAVEYEYDDAGNTISDACFGLDNERVLITSGFWKVVRTYNEKKQKIHEEYFGTDGNPISISEKYAMMDFVYDESGKLIKKILKDLEGNVVEEQTVE